MSKRDAKNLINYSKLQFADVKVDYEKGTASIYMELDLTPEQIESRKLDASSMHR